MFRHPKYYKELRKRNKSDQVISSESGTPPNERAPGPGQQLGEVQPCDREATPSSKPQASSTKQQAIEETVPHNDIEEALSQTKTSLSSETLKQQAASVKS